ncbi:MAG: hypothetical protein ACOY4U_04470 [Pseudomonadota bacterium]
MANDIVLGIRLTADGKGLAGEVRMSADAIRNLADETGKANVAAQKAAEAQRTLTEQVHSLAKEVVGATALWKAYHYAKEAALDSARYQTLGVVVEVVGRNAGYTATQMHGLEKALQKTGISMIESRQTLAMMAQANMDLAESTKLARVAQDAAVIGNLNSSEAFQRLVYGIQSGQTEVLRTIGINVNFEASYKTLAAQLHKNSDELTEYEKVQARANAVIEKGADIAGTYEAAMGTAGKQIKSMERYLDDLRVKQGEVFNEALTVGVIAFTEHLRDANHQLDEMAKNREIEQWGREVAQAMIFAANWIDNLATSVRLMVTSVAAALAESKALLTGDLQGYKTIALAWEDEVAKLTANYNRMDRAGQEYYARKRTQEQSALDHQREFVEKSLALQRLYGSYDSGTQRAAQLALANSYFPGDFPNKRADTPGGTSKKSLDEAYRVHLAHYDGQIRLTEDAAKRALHTLDQQRQLELVNDAEFYVQKNSIQRAALDNSMAILDQELVTARAKKDRVREEDLQARRDRLAAEGTDGEFGLDLIGFKASKEAERQRAELSRGQAELAGLNGQNVLFGMEGDARIEAERAIAQAAEDSRYQVQLEAMQREAGLMAQRGEMTEANARLYAARLENATQQHEARKLNITQQYLTAGQRFAALSENAKVEYVASSLSRTLAVGAQKYRELFELKKMADLAAVYTGTRKAMQLARETYPPPYGEFMAGIEMIAGMANAAVIASTSFGGGGGGGSGSVGGAAVPSIPSMPGIGVPGADRVMPTAADVAPVRRDVNVYLHGLATLRAGDLIDATIVRDQILPELVKGLQDGVGGANINLVYN